MKNIIKLTIFGLLGLFATSCQQEELRVHYPASKPVFDSISVPETNIVYGDSITLYVGVSDPLTPLSTLEIKVVVNDELIASETIRTKGNQATYQQRYGIPFVARMPDNAEVEIHLTSINVEGTKTDSIYVNTIAKRPTITDLYLVVPLKSPVKMKLTDAQNYIYTADNLSLENTVSFRLATKLKYGISIDWTGLVFGKVGNGIGLIDINGSPITLSDATLIGYKKITVDLFNFTVKGEGDKLQPATAMDISTFGTVSLSSTDYLNVTTKEDWKTKKMYLGKGTEMTISGIQTTNLANNLAPDFFEVTGSNTAKFLGETGIYTVYYLPRLNFVFVEQPDAVYPDAMWLCGVGFGPARTPHIKTSSWNWNTPLEYQFCRKVSDGVYQATFYALHQIDDTAAEPWRLKFSVKFFHQRMWGGEEDARTYTLNVNGLLFAPTESDQGNFAGTDAFKDKPGIYRLTIDVNNKTANFQKISD
ncbi:MAG TPA: DUF5016 domain-containing protein [Paludibacteraceae bacterium]|nr:DUF5016 domain-containing protein [Paludibacteraceae bacterium]